MKNHKQKLKVLFICKQRHNVYGISVGLINSAKFIVNVLNQHGIEALLKVVVDANSVDREVHLCKPTHVIIEALWVTPEKLSVLLARYPKIQWVVRVHSKAAFIANEGAAMDWLTRCAHQLYPKYSNVRISANNREFNDEISEVLGVECVLMPNIYQPQELEALPPKRPDPEVVDIGCFGAIRPLKNHLAQGIAAIRFGNRIGKKVRFHINAERIEQQGENALRNLRAIFRYGPHELVEHGWLDHGNFLKLARQMDIGMQVSLSESFNIVAADMVIEDVPVVVSQEIDWLPWFCQANPSDNDDIVSKLMLAYYGKRWGITILNKWALRYSNFANTKVWLAYFVNYCLAQRS